MGISKRGNKWWVRFRFRGSREEFSTGLEATKQNKSAAKNQESERRKALQESFGLRRVRRSFTEASASFLNWNDLECESPATAKRNRTSFATLDVFFEGRRVDEITPELVENYKTWRLATHTVKKVTVRHDLDALSKFFNRFAIPRGMALRNPMANVKRPSDKDSKRMHVVTDKEEGKYFEAARKHADLYDLGRLILLTGARPEELLRAKPEHFSAKHRTLRITFGKTPAARRILPLTDEAVAILNRRTKGKDKQWVFPSPRKPGAHLVKLNNSHDQALEDSDNTFRLYDLRHTYATRAIASGQIDVPTLAALLGHSNLRAVHLYVHPQEATKRLQVDAYNRVLNAAKQKAKRGTK